MPTNSDAFEELQQAMRVGEESHQFLEKIGSAIEQHSRTLGMPIRVIFAPAPSDPQQQLKDMSPDMQLKALDAIGCIMNLLTNDIDHMIMSLKETQFRMLKAKLHKGLFEDPPSAPDHNIDKI
jgi:hypothetical protein